MRLILISAMQVDKAVLFSALITVAGFVPLFTMQGVEGQIFGPMARTYGYALAGALIATFTITPVLASFLLPERVKETETIVVRFLHRIYNPALRFALTHRALVVGIELAISLGPLLPDAPRLGSEFLPHLEEGNFWIRASMPITLSLEDGEAAARKMREILLRHPEVITVVSQHGRPDDGSDASPFSNVELFAPLKPLDEWPRGLTKEKLTEQVQAEFDDELPGVVFNFSQYIQDNIEEGISGVKGANSVKIVGPNLETLTQLAEKVRDQMSQVRGITDLGIFPVLGQPNLNIKVDRAKAARYGLNSGDVNSVIQAAMGGAVATSVLEGDRQFDLVVRYTPEYRDSIDKIRNIKVAYTARQRGQRLYPVERTGDDHIGYRSGLDLSRERAALHPGQVQRARPRPWRHRRRGATAHREKCEPSVRVSAGLGRRVRRPSRSQEAPGNHRADQLRADCRGALQPVQQLSRLHSDARGHSRRGRRRCPGAVCLRSEFQHLRCHRFRLALRRVGHERHPDDHLSTTRHDLSGLAPVDAMYHAASTRMRPLLMTSLSACIGLFPAAISTGIGSQVQRPLATVIVGGMLLGPVMLLLAVPALRMIFLGRDEHPHAQSEDLL